MSLEVVTAPTSEPVTLTEAKDFCRVTHSDDDDFIDAIIKASRERVEAIIQRKILTTVLKYTLDKFPFSGFVLPGGVVQEVNTFTYLDRDGASQTVSASIYDLQINKTPAIIVRKAGYSWPSVYENGNAVIVNYDAGWASVNSVPQDILIAIKSLILFYYRNRELYTTEAIKMPSFVDTLLFPYKVF